MLEAAAKNQPPIEKGCTGEGVEALQAALLDLGYDLPISTANGMRPPDGIFGKETDAAVRAFQADQKLAIDGDVGMNTMRALDDECGYQDLKPAIHNVGLILATFSTSKRVDLPWEARRMRRIGGGFSRDSFWHLSQQLRHALIQRLPESKRADALSEWTLQSNQLRRFDEVVRQDEESGVLDLGLEVDTGAGGQMNAGTMSASGNPLGLIAMLAAVALTTALQDPRRRSKWSKSRPAPAVPSPSNAELWFLAFALTSLTAAAVQASIRRHQDAIGKCREKNAHRIPGCTKAILKFEEATNELRKCATVAQHSGGQFRFPGFVARAAKALSAYNEALKELAKCLACGPLGPLSF
jgi:hypothetical protein